MRQLPPPGLSPSLPYHWFKVGGSACSIPLPALVLDQMLVQQLPVLFVEVSPLSEPPLRLAEA